MLTTQQFRLTSCIALRAIVPLGTLLAVLACAPLASAAPAVFGTSAASATPAMPMKSVTAPGIAPESDPIAAFAFSPPASTQPATPAATATPAVTDAALARLHALSERASELALQAVGMLGIHYQRGGNTPETGLDCSGLVRYVFKQAWGTILPRTAEEISHVGKQVDHRDMQPGDLVFYNTLRRGFSHVGIYLGDNKFIHSPSAGGQVRIESMDLAYWKQRFDGARRIDQVDPAEQRRRQ